MFVWINLDRTVDVDRGCVDDRYERAAAHAVCGGIDPEENELVDGEGFIVCKDHDVEGTPAMT